MPTRRDHLSLLAAGLALGALVLAVTAAAGPSLVLFLAPAAALLLPLLLGRYIGEDVLHALRTRAPRRRAAATRVPAPRCRPRPARLLFAGAQPRRGPPSAVVPTTA